MKQSVIQDRSRAGVSHPDCAALHPGYLPPVLRGTIAAATELTQVKAGAAAPGHFLRRIPAGISTGLDRSDA
jgi:hypothetical protein